MLLAAVLFSVRTFNVFTCQLIVIIKFLNRYHQKAPTNWIALTTAFLFFVILFLVGYILYGAGNHIVKVEDDFHAMEELKVRAEAADIAKSQVIFLACCYQGSLFPGLLADHNYLNFVFNFSF